jgi:hypothetical protein
MRRAMVASAAGRVPVPRALPAPCRRWATIQPSTSAARARSGSTPACAQCTSQPCRSRRYAAQVRAERRRSQVSVSRASRLGAAASAAGSRSTTTSPASAAGTTADGGGVERHSIFSEYDIVLQ